MTDRFWKLASASAFALSLMASPALADFADWDGDASGAIDEEEWGEGFGENDEFASWDENEDGTLDEDEYESGVFNSYDDDDSGDLSEEEYGEYEEEEEEDDWF